MRQSASLSAYCHIFRHHFNEQNSQQSYLAISSIFLVASSSNERCGASSCHRSSHPSKPGTSSTRVRMDQDSSSKNHGNETLDAFIPPTDSRASEYGIETSSVSSIHNMVLEATAQKSISTMMSPRRQVLFMVFITLTQLVQMIPLGAGINSSLSIGEALGATNAQSVWIVASYLLTQGAFVLIGKCSSQIISSLSKANGMRPTTVLPR